MKNVKFSASWEEANQDGRLSFLISIFTALSVIYWVFEEAVDTLVYLIALSSLFNCFAGLHWYSNNRRE